MNKKNKKIAIISSSPLMMMLATIFIENGDNVIIFDKSKTKGGAWGWFSEHLKKYNSYIPRYTNIINPYNKKEVKFTKKMNKFLKKKFKVKVKKTKKLFNINYKYKDKFIYDFSKFYEESQKKIKFEKNFISKIETLANKKVLVNRKLIFDKVFIPSFAGIKEIKIYKKKTFIPECREIVSEHVSILAKKFKLKNFYYSQFFDNYFDRIKIEKIKRFYNLTARLDHSIKGISLSKLKNSYLDKFTDKKDLIDVKLSKFHNYYRNSEQLKKLKSTVKGSNVNYVDTTQFMCGFYAIRKILNV